MPPLPDMVPVLLQDHFNQPYRWGPTNPPVVTVEDHGDFVESWSGYGLGRSGLLVPPYVVPALNAEARPLFRPYAGAVRMWVSPFWSSASLTNGTGPGTEAILAEAAAWDGQTAPSPCWTLRIDADGTRVSLIQQSVPGAVELLSAPMEWEAGLARLVTLNFGTNGTELHLDGQLAAQGAGTVDIPMASAIVAIGSSTIGTQPAEAVLDEFYSFARPLTAAEVAAHYNGNVRHASMGPVTPEEELARSGARTFLSALEGSEMSFELGLEELDSLLGEEYGTEQLWLEITGVVSNEVHVTLHNTVPEVTYQLLSATNLSENLWTPEPEPYYALSNTIAAIVRVGDRTNSLFLRARSWVDTDGSGLPDWWQLDWFGQTGVAPYGDPDQDGWVNLQEYQNGTAPDVFNTPPAPQGLRAKWSGPSTALVSWLPSSGVLGYELYSDNGAVTHAIPANQSSYSETGVLPDNNPYNYFPSRYKVRAQYSGGYSSWSDWASLRSDENCIEIQVARGPGHRKYLVLSGVHADTAALRLLAYGVWGDPEPSFTVDKPISSFTNGLFQVPQEWNGFGEWCAVVVKSDGTTGVNYFDVWGLNAGADRGLPFYDGRLAMKQNLWFELRAANVTDGLLFEWEANELPFSTNYAYSGFWSMIVPQYIPAGAASFEPELNPYIINHLYRNFCFDIGHVDEAGFPNTGIDFWRTDGVPSLSNPTYELGWPTTTNPPPLLLSASESEWIYGDRLGWNYLSSYGMDFGVPGYVFLPNVKNIFGLPIVGAKIVWSNHPSAVITIGPGDHTPRSRAAYLKTADPQLETVGYYFIAASPSHPWTFGPYPSPGEPTFSVTNTTPPLIAAMGDSSFQIGGWAKQWIVNGYADKFAYLGQYFEKAYKVDSVGQITTNETGLLSPYGRFMPLEPGPTALVTMPDLDTGARGTAMVHAVSMALDRNHDGVMDLTYAGEDTATQFRPFTFWVNNDCDLEDNHLLPLTYDLGQDKDPRTWGADSASENVTSVRDFEDYARLWVCGVPALTNAGYQVTMGWANVSGNPAINLIQSIETNGGIVYLTDTNVASFSGTAWQQKLAGYGHKYRITTSNTIALPSNWFTNAENKYLLFEGAGIGSGQLVLTIKQNDQTIAQTSTWLDLKDVKDMFEHAHIEGVVTTFPAMRTNSTSTSTFKIDSQPGTGMGDANQLIALVHGWNNSLPQSEIYAQTMFKRLYWQGFQGRFASLRWPTLIGLLTYNRSEYIAFRSASGASAYFNSLRSRFPDYSINAAAHSMGNIVMMEALKLQAASGSNALNNYVLMEAAVPAHCYDTNAALCPGLFTEEFEHPTPNTYFGYPGAVTNALRGKMSNFFNTNDFALAAWVGNQLLQKPEGDLGYQIIPPLQPYLLSTLITDPREIMAFCARPRSYAIGAQPGVQGMVLGAEVDLHVEFGFGTDASDHSGQYTRSIQQVGDFYFTLRQKLNEQ
jgi:hypothetical protein